MDEIAPFNIPENTVVPEKTVASGRITPGKMTVQRISDEVIFGSMQDEVSPHNSDIAASWRTVLINPDHKNSNILGFLIKHSHWKPFRPSKLMCLTPEQEAEHTRPARSSVHIWTILKKDTDRLVPEIREQFGQDGSNQVWTHSPTSSFLREQTGTAGDMNCPLSLRMCDADIADTSVAKTQYDDFLATVRQSSLVSSNPRVRESLTQGIGEVLQERFAGQGATNQSRVGQQLWIKS